MLWKISEMVFKAACSLSLSGPRGEFVFGMVKYFRMSLVAAARRSRVEAVGILTSWGNHSTVSDILSALVDHI